MTLASNSPPPDRPASPAGGEENASPPPVSRRPFAGAIIILALTALIAIGFLTARHYFGRPVAASLEPAVVGTDIGGPFTLVDQDGRVVTDATFRGKYMLIYFGYTYCPDVCPTSLVRNLDALKLVGDERAAKVVPIMISVDPERDTPEKLRTYLRAIDPRLVGLTGSPEQVAEAARVYRVFYVRAMGQANAADDAYLVDHSSLTYLMDPDGRFLRFYKHITPPEEIAADLRKAIP